MGKRFNVSTFLVIVLAAGMGVIYTISLVSALSCLNKPFAGFVTYYPPYIGSLSPKGWPGTQAGLNYLDRIVSADGKAVLTGQDIVEAVRDKKPGTPVRYVVKSGDKVREITVPVVLFGFWDFVETFATTYLCGLVLCILGVIVVLLKANISSSWIFLAFAFALGGYLSTGFEIMTGYHLVRFHYVTTVIYPFAVLHLALIFPDRKRILKRFSALEYLLYIPALVLVIAWQVYLAVFPGLLDSESLISSILSYKFLGTVTRIFLLINVALFVVLISHSVFKAETAQARQRARMILFGVGVGFLPPVIIMLASHVFKIVPIWQILPFFVIMFPASVSYSIVRHNLFDADVIIRRTVGYAVVTAVVVGIYFGVSVTLNVFLENYEVARSPAFSILFTLGVIFIFNPLRNRVQSLVDRVFFRKEYDSREILDKIGGAMTSLLELGQILKRLVEAFVEDMFISTGSIMLLNPTRAEYVVAMVGGERQAEVSGKAFTRKEPLLEIIEKKKRELTKYDVLEDPQYSGVCLACADHFEALHASLMVPLVYQDEVIGVFNLGEKKSGKFFVREDIDLFRAIASQGAVAIENARLFKENLEKQRMEEELNIARDLQMSMLPSVCPHVMGFRLAATSLPAREVGGDFFDFIEMGEGKIGLVVGDVTGKSVSGALVMAAARSVFRMLSEEKIGVDEIMVRANRRTKKDITAGMFVALLYAVMNSSDRTVTLCSAGQTQPIHFSAGSGTVNLVETEGDTFPLGILEDANYQETRMQLAAGDRVVFYTDGIVEAMNDEEEIFGFERLQAVVREKGDLPAEALMEEILAQVNTFVGNAAQHDDLTVIVLAVDA